MGLIHLICACVGADTLRFADIYCFRGCEILSTEMGSFNYAARESFAKRFAKFSKVYDRNCLRKYKMLISGKMRDAKKIYVTFFSKNARFHAFRPEKSIQSTFFTYKIAFYFSEIFKFLEIDLLRKDGFKSVFLIQNEGKW